MQMDPAWMYEKAGKYADAALYWQRALRGLQEIYMPFFWNGDPATYAPGKYSEEYVKLPIEFKDRFTKCLELGKVDDAGRRRIEAINEVWMSEMIDHEGGDPRIACARRAMEAEKHGDFRYAEIMRRGEARFYRVVAIPYHQRTAEACEKQGRTAEAALHRQRIGDCEEQAAIADTLAAGDKVLSGVRGLGGPSPYVGIALYPDKSNPVAFQGVFPNRVFSWDGKWKGPSTEEVGIILKQEGLKHSSEAVRLSAVTVLANLGDTESVRTALNDSTPRVRLAAAKALVLMRWADGWAACAMHADAEVRAAAERLFESVQENPLFHTHAITTLMAGLHSASDETKSFCHKALLKISGESKKPEEWSAWWKQLGNARSGLTRTGSGVPPEMDETLDFGAWWHSGHGAIHHLPNPVLKYQPPTTIRWSGYLAVRKGGQYCFYVRNLGEGISGRNRVTVQGRPGFPGLFLPESCVKLRIAGKDVLSHPSDAMLDPAGGTRIDIGNPIRLNAGLHEISVEFDFRGYVKMETAKKMGVLGGYPCVRLYWSSDFFLRELVPAQCLVTKGG
jgi:hypothetical protein